MLSSTPAPLPSPFPKRVGWAAGSAWVMQGGAETMPGCVTTMVFSPRGSSGYFVPLDFCPVAVAFSPLAPLFRPLLKVPAASDMLRICPVPAPGGRAFGDGR